MVSLRGASRPRTILYHHSVPFYRRLAENSSTLDRSRTCNPRFRRPMLYPVELRVRGSSLRGGRGPHKGGQGVRLPRGRRAGGASFGVAGRTAESVARRSHAGDRRRPVRSAAAGSAAAARRRPAGHGGGSTSPPRWTGPSPPRRWSSCPATGRSPAGDGGDPVGRPEPPGVGDPRVPAAEHATTVGAMPTAPPTGTRLRWREAGASGVGRPASGRTTGPPGRRDRGVSGRPRARPEVAPRPVGTLRPAVPATGSMDPLTREFAGMSRRDGNWWSSEKPATFPTAFPPSLLLRHELLESPGFGR